jgi:hypothetical protein
MTHAGPYRMLPGMRTLLAAALATAFVIALRADHAHA